MLLRFMLVCVLVPLCECERVLVVFPVGSRSHTLLGDHVVKTLLDGGHHVTYITTFTRVKAGERLRFIDISDAIKREEPGPKIIGHVSELSSSLASRQILLEGTAAAERALRHPDVQALLHDTEQQFDLVVAEWYYTGLLAPLAGVFNCPLVWYSVVDASWMNLQLVHEAPSPVYSVDLLATELPRHSPSVRDRLYRIARQAYLATWVYYMTYYVESPVYYELYQKSLKLRGRILPLYEELVYNGSLLLINSHPLLGQGLALSNNAKYVGGHHITSSAAPLPQDLQALLDNARHGVIYFNLGSTFSEDLPVDIKQQLLRAFRQVEQTVIWRHRGKLDHVPGNVILVEKAPHHAILKHPNTMMVITHGGFLSYLEAMYHGVPIIGIPLEEDHLLTLDVVAQRGRGVVVPYSGRLGYMVKEAIIEILGNYSYRRSAKEASKILQHPLVPVLHGLLYWLELVMSTGGAPHLRSPAVQLTLMERYHLDVAAVIAMIAWFLVKVARLIKVYWNDITTVEAECDDNKKDQ